jgi:hypothetical protein
MLLGSEVLQDHWLETLGRVKEGVWFLQARLPEHFN